jgi:hypothetical protein
MFFLPFCPHFVFFLMCKTDKSENVKERGILEDMGIDGRKVI